MRIPIRLAVVCVSATLALARDVPEWVIRSNGNARVLLQVSARFTPEAAGQIGVEGVDREITDLKPGCQERYKEAVLTAIGALERRLASETDLRVRQDLEIMIQAAKLEVTEVDLQRKYLLPYNDVARLVFDGLHGLLDDQVPSERRRVALVRLRRYAGLEAGYTPTTKLAEGLVRERLKEPGLTGPFKGEVEKDLEESKLLMDGIAPLFQKFDIGGFEEPLAALRRQMDEYRAFIREEVLPRARTDFRQTPEIYALSLQQLGVDIPPDALAERAHGAFLELQAQMQDIAAGIARERGWKSTDYRDVIRQFKKDQLVGDAILPHYQNRLAQIEAIVRRERLVTLPDRPAIIRLATPAETAVQPAPHMQPPRLVGNTGESGAFVLPLSMPAADGKVKQYDDFTFAAASWTLTAHEARPGHEMQFASMIEQGVSTARAVFALNSTNVEGWGLYTEAVLQPYMPPEGQLVSLQFRLLRSARAFLDPELQAGKITPEQARLVLRDDVVLSEAMADQEVERYTFRAPGQATSYFCGYTRLMELRLDAHKALGPGFDQRRFHDFILSQGLLPPSLLRKAVFEQFVGKKDGPGPAE